MIRKAMGENDHACRVAGLPRRSFWASLPWQPTFPPHAIVPLMLFVWCLWSVGLWTIASPMQDLDPSSRAQTSLTPPPLTLLGDAQRLTRSLQTCWMRNFTFHVTVTRAHLLSTHTLLKAFPAAWLTSFRKLSLQQEWL